MLSRNAVLTRKIYTLRHFLPIGFNTRYTLHEFAPKQEEADTEELEIMKSDRPIFKGIERAVPASSISRAFNFAKLGGSLIGGTISQAYKSGFSGSLKQHALSEKNIEILTEGMLKMRGAALKLGQFVSFQDTQKLPPTLLRAMERTRREAYIMPSAQLERVLNKEIGENWRSKFDEFNMEPFAAASIGQVHTGVYKGKKVAIKVQYPGVDTSINSDLNNLHMLFTWTNILPKGLYFDALVDHTREDLINECNYSLEAEHQLKFKGLTKNIKGVYVPDVFEEVSTKHILVSEYVDSLVFEDFSRQASQKRRDSIGTRIMEVTLREIFDWKYMQTDPNPANFQYDPEDDELDLLDFGATRTYSDQFVEKYKHVVVSGVKKDREGVLHWSNEIGYFKNDEAAELYDAHVNACFAVGEPFSTPGLYDFGNQGITPQVYKQMPTMMQHRKCPPPPETYTLHRKLSGVYLLCMKLRAKVPAHDLFNKIVLKL
ncbi:unnamed protein product [Blepharisma stoltei]|uniref:ABC1 atypical kinase-like domain-containing protein n=1 Tax=Blepharisma stoltei TaxID=1481888 RepID=A0AAU9II32_9CILI|nr:unnamed protein product [Blepharisma stoltei]